MTDKDYIDHAINSIIFLHKYDESYKITKAAREKEEELFQGSIQFLKNLSVGKSESHIKTFTQTEQDFINRVKEIKISIDVPEFCKADIDLLCRHQLQPKYNNNAPKYMAIDDRCDECNHKEVCLNKEGYQKLIEELANSEVRFSIRCPYLSLKTKDEIYGEVK